MVRERSATMARVSQMGTEGSLVSFASRLTGSAIYLIAGALLAAGGAAIYAHVTVGQDAAIGPSTLGVGVGWVVFLSLVYGRAPHALDGGRPGVILTCGAAAAGVAAGIGAWWVSETSSSQLSISSPVALLAITLGIAVLVLAQRWQRGGRHQASSDHQLERSPRS
jgi:hypothetical protein